MTPAEFIWKRGSTREQREQAVQTVLRLVADAEEPAIESFGVLDDDNYLKAARRAVDTVLDAFRDDEDVAVNGFDKRNRDRVVRAVARALRR